MSRISSFFYCNESPTAEIYTLSLHDALPILDAIARTHAVFGVVRGACFYGTPPVLLDAKAVILMNDVKPSPAEILDRKSTRLNSSHVRISYAVFCLKKKIVKRSFKT